MKSVGEVMAIGRTFQESLQKAIRGLKLDDHGFDPIASSMKGRFEDFTREVRYKPTPERFWYVADAFRAKWTLEEIHDETQIDPWFLAQIEELVVMEHQLTESDQLILNHDMMLRI